MKRELKASEAKWLLEIGCVVLVSSGTMERRNIMTLSWQTPIHGVDPSLVLLTIERGHYTRELLRQTPELVINVPGVELLEAVQRIGSASGRGIDKFTENGLTPRPSVLVRPPGIEQCMAHVECAVQSCIAVEGNDLLICRVLRCEADGERFDGAWIPDKARTLHHLGGADYGVLERRVRAGLRQL